MTDTLQFARQHVKQEVADEFRRVEPHHALCGFMAVVFPAERHVSISDVDQAIVRDGDAMRVTPQVAEDELRPAERIRSIPARLSSRTVNVTAPLLRVEETRT